MNLDGRLTAANFNNYQNSNFIDDSKIIEMLQNDQSGFFQEIDMGQIDDEDKQFLIFDKDTGKVYDIRNEGQLQRITKEAKRCSIDVFNNSLNTTSTNQVWSEWWKEKRRNE